MEERHVIIQTNELYHSGVKGMQWGVRRWQDYTGNYTPAGRIHYGIGQGKNKGFSYATVERTQDKTSQEQKIFKQKERESTDRTQAMDDDMKAVNGGTMAARFAKDRRANCAYCTTAYELRRRGYDVKAKESAAGVMIDLDPSYSFKDAKVQRFDEAPNGYSKAKWSAIEKQIVEEQGEGARGNLFGTYKNSFAGHSVAYEIQNGKMVILDCQIAKRYDDSHEFAKDFKALNVIHTDNLEMDEKYIGNYVGNRSEVRNRMDVGRTVAKTLSLGGLGALTLGTVASWVGIGQIAIPGILAGFASVAVASIINKSRAIKETKAQYETLDKTLTKLNIDIDEANRRLDEIHSPNKPTNPAPKPKSQPNPMSVIQPVIIIQPAIASRIKSMHNSGRYTQEEIAKKLGISVSSVEKYT
jgi:hypothetical protein